jgi:hypothetical protein
MRYLSDSADRADAQEARGQSGSKYVVTAPMSFWKRWRAFW